MKKPAFAVILDRSSQNESHFEDALKIVDFVTEFVYVYESVSLPQNLTLKENLKYYAEINEQELIIASPRIGSIAHSEIYDLLIGTLRKHDEQEREVLRSIRGPYKEDETNLFFDFLFLNFWQAFRKPAEDIILQIQDMIIQRQNKIKEREIFDCMKKAEMKAKEENKDPDSHYPETMEETLLCKRCEIVRRKKNKRTRVRCSGCSVTYKKDIALCPECFADFHERINIYRQKIMKDEKICDGIAPKKRVHYLKSRVKKTCSEAEMSVEDNNNHEVQSEPMLIKIEPIIAKPENLEIDFDEREDSANKVIQKKLIEMDEKITETFSMIKELGEKGHYEIAGTFLGNLLNNTLSQMKAISMNSPEMNTGLTKIGSDVFDLAKTRKYEMNGGPKRQNIVDILLNARRMKMSEDPNYFDHLQKDLK